MQIERCRNIENKIDIQCDRVNSEVKIDTQKCMLREKETESQGGLKRLRDAVA